MRIRSGRFPGAALTLGLLAGIHLGHPTSSFAGVPVSFHTRALTGVSGNDPRGPGLGAGISFAAPMLAHPAKGLNNAGQTAFGLLLTGTGVTSSNNQLWLFSGPGGNDQIVRRGDPLTGFPPGTVWDGLGHISVSEGGKWVTTGGPPNSSTHIVTGTAGSLQSLFVPGSVSLPDVPLQYQNVIPVNVPSINAGGMFGIDVAITSANPADSIAGAFFGTPGNWHAVYIKDQQVVGAEPGVTAFASQFVPQVGTGGFAAQRISMQGSADPNQNGAIIGGMGDNIVLTVRTGTDGIYGPGMGPGIAFVPAGITEIRFKPQMNNSGNFVFIHDIFGPGVTNANNQHIWVGQAGVPGSVHTVAREGTDGAQGPNLGPGIVFTSPDDRAQTNDAGQVLFGAALTGAGVNSTNNRGLWIVTNDMPQAIARTGTDSALGPGLGAGFRFKDGVVGGAFAGNCLNQAGVAAFQAYLEGPGVTDSNDQGIWLWINGHNELIVREGQQVDVDNGPDVDLRTIAAGGIDWWPVGVFLPQLNQLGGLSAFNDNNQLAIKLNFTDGSQGIFVASIPEPTAPATIAFTVALLVLRRHRNK